MSHKKNVSEVTPGGDPSKSPGSKETSIYKRFKMNSHKIMIPNNPPQVSQSQAKQNKKLDLLKSKLGKWFNLNKL